MRTTLSGAKRDVFKFFQSKIRTPYRWPGFSSIAVATRVLPLIYSLVLGLLLCHLLVSAWVAAHRISPFLDPLIPSHVPDLVGNKDSRGQRSDWQKAGLAENSHSQETLWEFQKNHRESGGSDPTLWTREVYDPAYLCHEESLLWPT